MREKRQKFDAEGFLENGCFLRLRDGRYVVGWGALEPSDRAVDNTCCFYAPDFYLRNPTPYLVPSRWALVERAHLVKWLTTASGAKTCDSWGHWSEPDPAEFRHRFDFTQASIQRGEIAKAVLVVFATQPVGFDSKRLLRNLLRSLDAPAALHPYGYWSSAPASEGLLGASPELLFSIAGQTLDTMALAGTLYKRNASDAELEAFLNDPKERHEHELVVAGICDVLRRFGTIHVRPVSVIRLPNLIHLFTAIRARLHASVSPDSLVRALHPTPALGVSPREKSLNWLPQVEDPAERGRFGAPFVVTIPTHKGPLVEGIVAIRNMQWQGSLTRVGAGCGVVAQSRPELEWLELAAKRQSTLTNLGEGSERSLSLEADERVRRTGT